MLDLVVGVQQEKNDGGRLDVLVVINIFCTEASRITMKIFGVMEGGRTYRMSSTSWWG